MYFLDSVWQLQLSAMNYHAIYNSNNESYVYKGICGVLKSELLGLVSTDIYHIHQSSALSSSPMLDWKTGI